MNKIIRAPMMAGEPYVIRKLVGEDHLIRVAGHEIRKCEGMSERGNTINN